MGAGRRPRRPAAFTPVKLDSCTTSATTTSGATSTAAVQGIKAHRRCKAGKVKQTKRVNGKKVVVCVKKHAKKISRKPRTLSGLTG